MARQSVRRRGAGSRKSGGASRQYSPAVETTMVVERPGKPPAVLGCNGVAVRSSPRLNAFQMEKTKAKSRSDRGGLQFPITETPYDKFFYTLRVQLGDGWKPKALALLHGTRLEDLDTEQPGTCWLPLHEGDNAAGAHRLRVIAKRHDEGSGYIELDMRLHELDKVGGVTNTRALLPDRKRDPVRVALVLVHVSDGREHWVLSEGFLLKTKWGTQKGASIRHEAPPRSRAKPGASSLDDPASSRRPRRLASREGRGAEDRKRKRRESPEPRSERKAARHVAPSMAVHAVPLDPEPNRIATPVVPQSPTPVDRDLTHHFEFNFKDDPLFSDLVYAQAWAGSKADPDALGLGGGEWVDLSGGGGGGGVAKAESAEAKPVLSPTLALGAQLGSSTVDEPNLKPRCLSPLGGLNPAVMDWAPPVPKTDPGEAKLYDAVIWFDSYLNDLGTLKSCVASPLLDAEEPRDVKPVLLLPPDDGADMGDLPGDLPGSTLLDPAMIQSLLHRSMSFGSD